MGFSMLRPYAGVARSARVCEVIGPVVARKEDQYERVSTASVSGWRDVRRAIDGKNLEARYQDRRPVSAQHDRAIRPPAALSTGVVGTGVQLRHSFLRGRERRSDLRYPGG